MRIKHLMVIAVCATCMAMMIFPVYAETDPFGHEIDWIDEQGGDDTAGNETEVESANPSVYDVSEKVEGLQQMQEAETEAPQETGYLLLSIAEPETWSEESIEVTLWRGKAKETVWLYRQNGWEARAQLPAGDYTFQKAVTSAGETFEPEVRSFRIAQDSVTELLLTAGDAAPEVTMPAVATSPGAEEPVTDRSLSVIAVIAFAFCLTALTVLASLIIIRKGRRDYRNDILD